jgi:hypothetical protein
MIKDRKLIQGPGMTGKMQPIRPHNAKSNPEIINMIVKIVCPSCPMPLCQNEKQRTAHLC